MRFALALMFTGLATPAAAAPASAPITPQVTPPASPMGGAPAPAVRRALPGLRGKALRGGREQRLVRDTDYLLRNDPLHERANTTAPLAFAGLGVTAPEQGYDDYAHMDVRGKVAVILSGAPQTFPSERRASYSSGLVKTRNAIARGAVGIVTVRTPVDEARAPWGRVINQSRLPGMCWLDSDGVPNESYPQLGLTSTLRRSGANALFADASIWSRTRHR